MKHIKAVLAVDLVQMAILHGRVNERVGEIGAKNQVDETWPPSPACVPHRLVLTWGAHEMEVTDRRPTLTVGRGGLNDIVIKSGMVSRLHARIEFRNASFSLTDQSSNGTYIADSVGTTRVVRNATHALTGAGTISFGINPKTSRPHLVRYAVNP